MLTQKAKYALKAMLHLARAPQGTSTLAARIADAESVPRKFLELILLELKNEGLVRSRRGRGGGYALARPASEITFGEIIRIAGGPLAPIACASKTAYRRCEDCRDEATCETRQVMARARDAIAAVLDGTTLADAISGRDPDAVFAERQAAE